MSSRCERIREVLNDADFGELYVGSARPERWRHVFASVQSLTAYGVDQIPADAYEIVVIDEFHHAEARTYRRIIDHLTPRELLGLTATPERADGMDVRSFFDGRTAVELRLWEALGADLLCPFHYFAVADGTDLRAVTWSRADTTKRNCQTSSPATTLGCASVLRELRDKVADVGVMRALGFCVSVAHAEYMARKFVKPAFPLGHRAVGRLLPSVRQTLDDLRARRINAVFAVDVLKRRTRHPRRRHRPHAPSDRERDDLSPAARSWPAAHADEGRPDGARLHRLPPQGVQLRPALSSPNWRYRRGLERQIEEGFPFLPSGCQIVLDKQAQNLVLENIRSQIANRWQQIVSELRTHGEQDLAAGIPRRLGY